MKHKIRQADFNEILPIWKNQLWPGRKSPIERSSSICLGGGYKMDYLSREVFYFICERSVGPLSGPWARRRGPPAGVVSCFATEEKEFRMRGLYVFPQFRSRGIAKALALKCQSVAAEQGGKQLWTLARETKKAFYKKLGFTHFFGRTEDYEFGPHLFARMALFTSKTGKVRAFAKAKAVRKKSREGG